MRALGSANGGAGVTRILDLSISLFVSSFRQHNLDLGAYDKDRPSYTDREPWAFDQTTVRKIGGIASLWRTI
jgi:hypothetical protein